MRTSLLVVSVCLALVCGSVSSFAQDVNPDKMEAIVRLVEVSGQALLMRQGMSAMIGPMRRALPEMPEEFFAEFKKAALGDELVELLIPVYERHFTYEEILALIKFYKSPIGQSLVQKQPLVQQDAMDVGQAWGAKKAQEIVERLKKQGLISKEPSEGETID